MTLARVGRFLVAIAVTDLDSHIAELADSRIDVGSVAPVGDAGRQATIIDPDGNSIAVIQIAR